MLCAAGTLLVLGTGSMSAAQPVKTEAATAATKASGEPGPAWAALNPLQRQALAPLAASWDSLSAGQQRKWLEVSRNYPALTVADQAKMHGRMSDWVALSARERSAARLNFAATAEIAKELSPQEKKAKWDAYQALSPDERKKLANQASRPPVGAAPATRPVATQKLAVLPGPANAAAAARPPKMPADPKPEAKPVQAAPGSAAEAASTAAVPADRTER
jgi:hypothetical protein